MATVATRREKKTLSNEKNKRTDLTPTGLFMEGLCTQVRLSVGRRSQGAGFGIQFLWFVLTVLAVFTTLGIGRTQDGEECIHRVVATRCTNAPTTHATKPS